MSDRLKSSGASGTPRTLGEMSVNYGCFISEQYDFGPAKNINGLFMDLIRITPFSKDEQIKYSRLLDYRNLCNLLK